MRERCPCDAEGSVQDRVSICMRARCESDADVGLYEHEVVKQIPRVFLCPKQSSGVRPSAMLNPTRSRVALALFLLQVEQALRCEHLFSFGLDGSGDAHRCADA